MHGLGEGSEMLRSGGVEGLDLRPPQTRDEEEGKQWERIMIRARAKRGRVARSVGGESEARKTGTWGSSGVKEGSPETSTSVISTSPTGMVKEMKGRLAMQDGLGDGSGETLWDKGECLEDGGDGGSNGCRGEGWPCTLSEDSTKVISGLALGGEGDKLDRRNQ